MGQKVNPYGFRLGINKDWRSHWYAEGRKIVEYLREDIEIRRFIKTRLKGAEVSKIEIDRAADRLSISIFTARPGMVIGRKGAEVEVLRKKLGVLTGNPQVAVNINEVKVAELDAQLVAESIARRIEHRVSHRRAMKRALDTALRMGARGIRIECKGRLGGRYIARKEGYLKGRVPLHTLRADIEFGRATAFTKYGTTGVKCWVYKGDVQPAQSKEG